MNERTSGVSYFDSSLGEAHASFQGEAGYDYSGICVDIAGDVNGDGFDDFLIGAHGNDDGGSYAGKVYLFFGKEGGWSIDTAIQNADASFIGEASSDYAGSSLSGAGDVNGDGFDDFVIGAYGNDDGGSAAGKVYLIFGKATGWSRDTDLTDADVSFYGETAGDEAGEYVAGAGDVNRDGYDDILISTINNDEAASNAGKVYLILGRESGWRDSAQLSIAEASFRGEAASDIAGRSMEGAGDVNGDGYADIIIGAPINGEASTTAGQVYLIFGKTSGWSRNTSLSSSGASFRGESSADQAGLSVAGLGDVNGDTYDDVLISAPYSDDGGTNAGEVYLVLGKNSGWSMDTSLSSADGSYLGEHASDELGWALSGGGDLDDDGLDDLIISSRVNDDAGTNTGKTYLIPGRSSGWVTERAVSSATSTFLGESDNDNSGYDIATGGDVNGDGYDDLIIGAYQNGERGTGSGQTYLLLYNADPPAPRNLRLSLARDGSSITLTFDPPAYWSRPIAFYFVSRSSDGTNYINLDTGFRESRTRTDFGVTIGQTYYYRVRAVDLDERMSAYSDVVSIYCDRDYDEDGLGDSIDPDDDNDGIPDVYDSNPYGRDFTNWGRVDIDLSTIGTEFYGESRGDMSGLAIDMSGDVNGDGIDDLVIGSYANDEGGTTAGKVYLFFGKSGGWSRDMNLSEADASFIGEESNDRAGISVCNAGDVNGDGYHDIVIGADEYEPMGGQRGRVYIILGKPSGWRTDQDLSRANVRIWGEYNDDEFGASVHCGGGLNGDGCDDIIIGAPSFEPTNTNYSGKSYLLKGRSSFPYFIYASTGVDASFIGAGDDEHSGCSVAMAGDVDRDGLDDILIGARFYKRTTGGQILGRVYLLLGKRTGWSRDTTLTSPDASFIGQLAGAGWSVAGAGDVNGDGYDDIIIGEPENSESYSSAGQAYLIFGKPDNWTRNFNLADADASFWGESAYDNAGYYVDGAGDVNWDGLDDIIIGAPRNEEGGYISPYYAGKTYIVYGKRNGWQNDVDLGESDVSFIGEVGDDMSGYTVAGGGDPDNDGRPDILIGAWSADHYGSNTGTTYLIGHTEYEPVENVSSEYKEGSQGIHLSWDDTVSDPGFYGIYRGVLGGSLVRLANTTSNNYTDWDITLGLTYTYYVVAVDPFGTSSPLSNPIHILADKDSDQDGIGNVFDWDDDGDGYPDGEDDFPLNASEWLDTDIDGIGNNYDTDDDNDGIPDTADTEPLNPLNGISSEINLDELYDRLVDMEGNLTSGMASMESNLRTRIDNMWNNVIMHIRGMNATMRAFVTQSISQVMGRIDSLQTSVHSHIDNFWDDYNSTEQSQAQYLMGMNDRILLAISDLEDSLSAQIAGLAGPGNVIGRIDDLEDRYNISISSLLTDMADGFTSVETLMTGEFTDMEAYIALRMVQLQGELELVNLSLHHHLDSLGDLFEEMLDEDMAYLVIVIEGETTTIGELVRSEVSALADENNADHDAIIQMLTDLAEGSSDGNLSQILTEIQAIQTSLNMITGLNDVITNIETMEVSMEEGNQELSDNDGRTHLLLIILIVLVSIVLIMVIVNIILGKLGNKEKDETLGDQKG